MPATSKSARQKGFSYLLIKGSSVHFRISVPPLLRPILGCTEFHRSLGTKLLREAKPIAAILGARLGMLFRDTVKRIVKGETVDIEKLNKLVHDMLDSELSRLDLEASKNLVGANHDMSYMYGRQFWDTGIKYETSPYSEEILGKGVTKVKSAYSDEKDIPSNIAKSIRALLGEIDAHSLQVPKYSPLPEKQTQDNENAIQVARGLNTATSLAYQHVGNKLQTGIFSNQVAHEELNGYYPFVENRVSGISNTISVMNYPKISEAVERYIDNVKLDVQPGTLKNYKLHLSKFVDFYGEDATLDMVNNESVADFSRYLFDLPTTKSGQTTAVSSVVTILETVRTFFGKVKKYYKGVIGREFTDDIRDDLNERIRKTKDVDQHPYEAKTSAP